MALSANGRDVVAAIAREKGITPGSRPKGDANTNVANIDTHFDADAAALNAALTAPYQSEMSAANKQFFGALILVARALEARGGTLTMNRLRRLIS